MKSKIHSVLSVALLCCAPILAQEVPKVDLKKADVTAAQPAPETRSVVGTVKEFQPGKLLRVQTLDLLETYKLDDKTITVKVDSSLVAGTDVRVTESIDAAGKRTVTIEPRKPGESKKAAELRK